MTEDSGRRPGVSGHVFWRREPRVVTENGAADHVVGPLISVLLFSGNREASRDREAGPVIISRDEIGPGHGYACRCASSGGAVLAHRFQDAMIKSGCSDAATRGADLRVGLDAV
jgi:hypothetical protein